MPEITVFGVYVVAALLLAGIARSGATGTLARLGPMPAIVAVVAHGWLLWHAVVRSGLAHLNLGNTVSLSGWLLALMVIPFAFRTYFRGLVALFLSGVSISVLFTHTASVLAPPGQEPLWQFINHAVMATLSYSLLAAAATLAIMTTLKDRRLRQPGETGWMAMLPPLESMERLMFAAIIAGFVLLSLTMFSGLVFVRDFMAQHLTHKSVLTTVAWVVFAVLLFGRWRFGWRGRKAVNWTLAGFSILALAYFGSRIVLEVILGRQWG